MTSAQTCLYLLKCARMTMLMAWPNIRKSLLHLMLLAELFCEGRAGKIAMPPWASGSGREVSQAWLRGANEGLAPRELPHAAAALSSVAQHHSFLYLASQQFGRCVTWGAFPGQHSRKIKKCHYLCFTCKAMSRLCKKCPESVTSHPKNELCIWQLLSNVPLLWGWDFFKRKTNCHWPLWYNLDSCISTALTLAAGSVSLAFSSGCSKTHLWEVRELIFGFVPHSSPKALYSACRSAFQWGTTLTCLADRAGDLLGCVCGKSCLVKCHPLSKKWCRSLW